MTTLLKRQSPETITNASAADVADASALATASAQGAMSATDKSKLDNIPTLGTAAAKDVPTSGNASSTQVVKGDDTRLSDTRSPSTHATTHQPGGTDAMVVDAVVGTGSLRTIGTGGQQACAGNDSRLSNARTPSAHAASHASAGSDPLTIDDSQLSNNVALLSSPSGQTFTQNIIAPQFAGDGSQITNISAYNVSTGQLNVEQCPGGGANGANQLVQLDAFGNLPALSAQNLTNFNAEALNPGGTLPALYATNLLSIPSSNLSGPLPGAFADGTYSTGIGLTGNAGSITIVNGIITNIVASN